MITTDPKTEKNSVISIMMLFLTELQTIMSVMLADVETVSCQWLSLPRSHFNNGLFAYLTRIRRQCEVNKLSFKLLLPYKARALAIVHLLDVYATSGYSQGKCDNRKAPFY